VGLYGVISFDVAQRSQEIGVRLALGAESSGVLRLILRQGLRLTALGVVLGLLGSVALSRFLGSQLYEVGAMCPLTFVAVVVILFTVATAASLVPARRATRVDPLVAMRSE
jgi:ABC-type antimicrobial peptide transport system permease subunit